MYVLLHSQVDHTVRGNVASSTAPRTDDRGSDILLFCTLPTLVRSRTTVTTSLDGEGGREGGRKEGREGGKKEGREGGREEVCTCVREREGITRVSQLLVLAKMHSLEDVQRFECSIELCQLLELQLLQVIVIAWNIDATLNDVLDLMKRKK